MGDREGDKRTYQFSYFLNIHPGVHLDMSSIFESYLTLCADSIACCELITNASLKLHFHESDANIDLCSFKFVPRGQDWR